MKRILFPTDFSEASKNAFVYALKLADAIKAEVITPHAYELPQLNIGRLPNTIKEVYDNIELENFEDFKGQIPVLREIAEKYQLGPLGIIERELSEFETFYRNNENLVNGARVAVILVLNPMDPLSLDKLKNILAQQSVVYAFSANVSERPNFEPGNIITRKST